MSYYEEVEFFVEKVVDKRSGKTGNVKYLWKWKGHGSPKVYTLVSHDKNQTHKNKNGNRNFNYRIKLNIFF